VFEGMSQWCASPQPAPGLFFCALLKKIAAALAVPLTCNLRQQFENEIISSNISIKKSYIVQIVVKKS